MEKVDYKIAQHAGREKKFVICHDTFRLGTLDLGIKAFKRLGTTSTQIREYKAAAWNSR